MVVDSYETTEESRGRRRVYIAQANNHLHMHADARLLPRRSAQNPRSKIGKTRECCTVHRSSSGGGLQLKDQMGLGKGGGGGGEGRSCKKNRDLSRGYRVWMHKGF